MKKALTTILLLGLIFHTVVGQIQYQEFGEVFPDDVMFVEDIGPLEPLEEVKDSTKRNLMLGFRNTDIKSIEAFLSPKLQGEIIVIDSLLNSYEKKFKSIDSIFLYENSGFAFGQTGTLALTKFSHKALGELAIEYQYYCPNRKTIINKIIINGKKFPSELSRISKLRSLTRKRDLTNRRKFEIYTELLNLISPKEGLKFNEFYLPQSNNELSRLNGNLSWYALNIGENEIAVNTAKNGLYLNPSNKWINTNLALGLVQLDKLEDAFQIYKELKNVPYNDKLFKDVFLSDLDEVEANGIKIKHKKKIIEMLTKE